MSRFQQLVEATRADYAEHILGNPLIARMATGQVDRDLYVAYLVQTYHLVRHTSRTLALAASRCGEPQRGLRNWFLEQAAEEDGHELFCLRDLKNLDLDPDACVAEGPGPGAWGLFTQNYYMAGHGNPVGMLGVATATEGMGAELAGGMARLLSERHGIPDEATTFLRSHAGFDQKHLEEARRAVDEHAAGDDEFTEVLRGRRMTYRHYGQLFADVAGSAPRRAVADRIAA